MSTTNFARLTTNQLTVWSRDIWEAARNYSFLHNFVGDSANAMVQRISELKQTSKGARAVYTLVTDLVGDGVVGDNQMEGNEESINAYDQAIQLDQIRNANRLEGRMADQNSVVAFRQQSKDKLAYWLANRVDQLGFLTLSGISYNYTNQGALKIGSQFPLLSFAGDVTAPTANRHYQWSASSNALVAPNTTALAATDTPSWAMLVQAKAQAVSSYMRPIRTDDGILVFNVFMSPQGMAALKQDSNFIQAWRYAMERGAKNPIFKGTPQGGSTGIMIDGLNILEYRNVYTNTGAPAGSQWGSTGNIPGQRVLICGAQSLCMADIGLPKWVEKDFDYDNSPGISISKIVGLKKPVFPSIYTGATDDFGVMCIDTAI